MLQLNLDLSDIVFSVSVISLSPLLFITIKTVEMDTRSIRLDSYCV